MKGEKMEQYTKEQYVEKFGAEMWTEKVEKLEDGEIESVWATGSGNIFMIIMAEQ